MLSVEEVNAVLLAETSSYPSPVPTQIVSSDEYMPRRRPPSSANTNTVSRNSARACVWAPTGVPFLKALRAGGRSLAKAEAQTPELANAPDAGRQGANHRQPEVRQLL